MKIKVKTNPYLRDRLINTIRLKSKNRFEILIFLLNMFLFSIERGNEYL